MARIERWSEDHHAKLASFLARAYPDAPLKADPAYLRWRLASSPAGSALDHYWLLLEDDAVIGQVATMTERVWMDGRLVSGRSLVDLVIDERHRGAGLDVVRLLRGTMRSAPLVFAAGAGPAVFKLYDSLKFRRIRTHSALYFPLRPGRIAAQLGPQAPSRRVALAAADRLVPPLARIATVAARAFGSVRRVGAADASVRILWSELRPKLGITHDRSTDMLEWKFEGRPAGRHELLVAERAGRAVGFAALRWFRRPRGNAWLEIADYVAAPNDVRAVLALSAAAVRRAARDGCDFVRVRVSMPVHVGALRRVGFLDRTREGTDEVFVFGESELVDRFAAGPHHATGIAGDRNDFGADEW